MQKIFMYTLISGAVLALTACSGARIEKADPNPTPHDTVQGEGVFSGKSGNILEAFRGKKSEAGYGDVASIGVNPYLWRASLEALSFMPISQADSAGGVILTDWYANPNNVNERVKVNVLILGRLFKPQTLEVKVFKQRKNGDSWSESEMSSETSHQLEDTILTKARVLRVKERAAQ